MCQVDMCKPAMDTSVHLVSTQLVKELEWQVPLGFGASPLSLFLFSRQLFFFPPILSLSSSPIFLSFPLSLSLPLYLSRFFFPFQPFTPLFLYHSLSPSLFSLPYISDMVAFYASRWICVPSHTAGRWVWRKQVWERATRKPGTVCYAEQQNAWKNIPHTFHFTHANVSV